MNMIKLSGGSTRNSEVTTVPASVQLLVPVFLEYTESITRISV